MPRTSRIYHIAPSNISIMANANGLPDYVAVNIANETKVKVYSPKAGIDLEDSSFREWTLAGRNRLLADSAAEYTIYIRVQRFYDGKAYVRFYDNNAYLLFVRKNLVDGKWTDRYRYVTEDGESEGESYSSNYFLLRIGDVSLPENGQRTITFDTGILGTDEYNTEYDIDPSGMPLRVELGCAVDDEDAGSAPYVYWDQDLVLTAALVEGWSAVAASRIHHWEITRNSGDPDADEAWNHPDGEDSVRVLPDGSITLSHSRSEDDFNGAVASLFTVTAFGRKEDWDDEADEQDNDSAEDEEASGQEGASDGNEEEPVLVAVKSGSISIYAETVERYDLQLSTSVVGFSPKTGVYSPGGGVDIRISATDQRGDRHTLTCEQVEMAGLVLEWSSIDTDEWTPVAVEGTGGDTAVVNIPVSAFSAQKSVNVRLTNALGRELDKKTVAFVRDGEDTRDREWIFVRSDEPIVFGDADSSHPLPSLIEVGQVDPEGEAAGDDDNKDQDGWVPQGWWDEELGASEEYPYEYGAYRDYIRDADGQTEEEQQQGPVGHWGDFSEPRIYDHYGRDGEDAYTVFINPSNAIFEETRDGSDIVVDTSGYTGMVQVLKGGVAQPFFVRYGTHSNCQPATGSTPEDTPVTEAVVKFSLTKDGGGNYVREGYIMMTIVSVDGKYTNGNVKIPYYLSRLDTIKESASTWFLSKTDDDVAEGEIGFLKGLWVKAKGLFGVDGNGNAAVNNLQAEGDATIGGTAHVGADAIVEANGRVKGELNVDGNITSGELIQAMRGWFDELQSQNFSGHSGIGSGWGITNDYNGKSRMTIDELLVRGRFIIEELLVKRKEVTAGDQMFTCAANRIALVRYFNKTEGATVDDGLMGYEKSTVPWLLNMKRLLSGDLSVFGKIFSLEKNIYVGVRQEDLRDVKRIRCYFLAYDGDRRVDNLWKVGDLALCHTYNLTDINREYETKHGNIHWWRRVVDVSKATSIVEGKEYHWFDVLYSQADNHLLTNDWEEDSDIPFTGDDAVQFGHFPTDDDFDVNGLKASASDRMNAAAIEVNGAGNEDAPCYKLMFGIYTFSLSKCWYGGPVIRMSLSPKTGYRFYGPHFEFITADNKPIHTVIDRAEIEWSKIAFEKDALNTLPSYSDDVMGGDGTFAKRGDASHTYDKTYVRKVWFYERVSHKGSLWVCVRQSVSRWLRKTDGQLMPETWHPTPSVNIDDYESILTYCTSEPSLDSRDWQRQVSKGTSIIEEEVAYAASLSGVTHPTEGWKVVGTKEGQYANDDLAIAATGIKPGQYLWTRKKTVYSDTLQPTYQYSVNRWGIDGDGIASINSYYATTQTDPTAITVDNMDNYTWYDTYQALIASVQGGLASMQGWYIWEKTVITYDLANNPDGTPRTEPDLISFRMTRIGMDGQIGQESYYCLRESDTFNDAFGGTSYAQCGIKWYSEESSDPTDTPRDHRYRLASGAAINENIWKNKMPVYDATTEANGRKKFLWTFEYSIDGQGTAYASMPICIGNHSKGIKGTPIRLYACSAYMTPRQGGKLPEDIYKANGNSDTDYSHTEPQGGQDPICVWDDEAYNRVVTEAHPYQWKMVITNYTDGTSDRTYEVSVVRGTNGEDGAADESIFFLSTSSTFSGTLPANITKGQVSPGFDNNGVPKVADGSTDYNNRLDDWVPQGWTDNPRGISAQNPYEFVSTRKLGTPDANGRKTWGAFSKPVLRSNWGKNGIDGDGTEYVFMRTKNDVAPTFAQYDTVDGSTSDLYKSMEWLPYINNKGTGSNRANAESNRCTDNPKGTTAEFPYEWVAKRNMASPSTDLSNYGTRVWKSYYECTTETIGGVTTHKMSRWDTHTTLRLAIDNEMDFVPTNSMGVVTEDRTIETNVRLYDSASLVSIGNPNFGPVPYIPKGSTTETNLYPSITPDGSATVHKLAFAFKRGDQISAGYNVNIVATYNGTEYVKELTILASKGQPIYQMMPSVSELKFSRNADNSLSAPPAVKMKVVKIDGEGTTEYDSAITDIVVRYSKTSMPTTYNRSGDSNWDWTNGVSVSTADVANGVTDLHIAMFRKVSNTVYVLADRETLSVVKDGEHGKGGDTPMQAFQWNDSGTTAPSPLPTKGNYDNGWSQYAPNRPNTTEERFLWMTQCTKSVDKSGVVSYSDWQPATRISGNTGSPGEDASDLEWIYYLSSSASYGTAPSSIEKGQISPNGVANGNETDKTKDDWVPNGWRDNPAGVSYSNQYEYASFRQKQSGHNQSWGTFQPPILWSHWGTNGMDGDGVEYVFARTESDTPPQIANNTAHDGKDYTQDEFLPAVSGAKTMSGSSVVTQSYATDDPQGVTAKLPYEWVAKRTKGAANQQTGKRTWEGYTIGAMQLWARYSEDGGTPEMRYQWNQNPTSAPSYTASAQNPGSSWSKTVPNRPADGYYLWAISAIKNADGTYGTWGNAIRLTGDAGTPGEDGDEREWIYSYSNSGYDGNMGHIGGSTDGTITNKNQKDWIPNGWKDNPAGVSNTNKTEYASWRDITNSGTTKTYGAFQTPIVWSHYGERGMDGDGVEYVFARTKENVTPSVPSSGTYSESSQGYNADEHLPYVRVSSSYDISGSNDAVTSGGYKYVKCTDDPVGTDSTWKYEWVLKRSKAAANSNNVRAWEPYSGNMALWAKWSQDGKSITKISETYEYATNNTGVRPAASSSSWSTTKPTLNKGYWLYTKITITWSDTSTTVLYTDERNPNDGQPGQDIVTGSTTVTYKLTQTNQQPADSEFGNYPSTLTKGYYLWSKATTPYYKGSVSAENYLSSSSNYSVSYIAEDGDPGRSITKVTEYYKATNSPTTYSQAPTSDSGWYSNPNSAMAEWGSSKKYLWNYEKVEYSSGTTVERTIPTVIAIWTKDGDAGKGIDSITNYYLISESSSGVTRNTSGWDDDPIAPTADKPYLWNYERITWLNYGSGNQYTYTEPQVIGHFGRDGAGYEIRSTVGSVTIAQDVNSGSLSTTVSFLKNSQSYSAFYAVYKRSGTTYVFKTYSTAKKSSFNLTDTISNYKTHVSNNPIDAYVIVMGDSSFTTGDALPTSYLAKLEIPVYKQGDTGPEGIGEDGYSVVASPAAVVLSESLTSENSFSLPQYIEFSVQGNSSVSVSNVAVDSMSNVTASKHNSTTVKITAVTTTNKPTQGYVVTNVSLSDGTTKSVKVLVAINWQGTIKTSIEGSVETTVAEAVDTAIEEGDFVTTETLGYYVRSDSESYVGLQRSVNGAVTDASEAKQTADEISLLVSGTGNNVFVNSQFDPSAGESYNSYTPDSWTISGSSVALKNTLYKDGHVLRLYSGSYISQQVQVTSLNTGGWNTIAFFWGRYSSNSAKVRVYFECRDNSGNLISAITAVEVDGVITSLEYDSGLYYVEIGDIKDDYTRHTVRFTINYYSVKQFYVRFQGVSATSYLAWPQLHSSSTSGIDIKKDVVDVLADCLTVHNSAGEQTMGLNAKGDFEVSGTIKAKNFYHRVCVTNGTYYSSYKYYYNGSYYDEYGTNRVLCTYDADVICVTLLGTANINLPRPEDFEGKLVTVNAITPGQSEISFNVRCANLESRMLIGLKINSNNTGIEAAAEPTTNAPMTTGTSRQFLSVRIGGTCYWVMLQKP